MLKPLNQLKPSQPSQLLRPQPSQLLQPQPSQPSQPSQLLQPQPSQPSARVPRLVFATGLFARMRGMLSRKVCAAGEVLVLVPCKSIHTYGMREALDVAFVDGNGVVLKSQRALQPNNTLACSHASITLERRTSAAYGEAWLEEGQRLGLTASSRSRR